MCIRIYLRGSKAIAGVRGFDSSTEQTMDRLLSTLLMEMDGVGTGEEVVIVVAATNDIAALDPAILRPGRLDLHILMSQPDRDSRRAIFAKCLRDMPLEGDVDQVAGVLAGGSAGMTGADIQGLCQEAALLCLREVGLQSSATRPLQLRHLQEALTRGFRLKQ
jgi:transitional endoplasmic reticulum ATPase